MPARARIPLAAVVVVLLSLVLGACSGSSERPRVSGLSADTRYIPRKTASAVRPHYVRRCTTNTERVKHTSSSGSGKHKRKRTWYTTENRRSCHQVRRGSERYTRLVHSSAYCVELNNVNGKKTADNRWYEVDQKTYRKAEGVPDGKKLRFRPVGDDC
ncbi:hypothetical protein [Streptomyces tsukubensis]|uniref:hypothetical protein n=1 Tax=Streptomyces tsukubensis TaxID=83656 RepID=UPI00117BE194|nr:hypothetical protein [Streptomyces tsukubensis]QFR93672.1 hypothetical protein GBW32_11985 [Streptomyces tsukubensis]